MDSLLKKYLRGDATLWIAFIMLCVVSIIEMYSASSTLAYKAANHTAPMLRHVGFLAGGALIAIIVHLIPYRFIRLMSYLGLLLSIVLLILVQFMGQSENDATRWLVIGGVQFQPSELAKLSVIIVAADFISRIKNPATDENRYFWSIMVMLALICPLILIENFSTAGILFGVVFIMMFIGKISMKKLGIIAGGLIVAAIMGYGAIKAIPSDSMPKPLKRAYTWTSRIDKFFVEDADKKEDKYAITDDNLQVQHGKIAIARGGIFGVMPGNSVERDFLPQAYSDFIFAIIVEEIGLIGGFVVMLLYLILLYRAGRIAMESPTVFPAVVVIGLSLMIVIQAFVNMAVATSLGPVTGQPLPLISRGGTSILITCIYFGVILGVTRQIKEEGQPQDKEMDTTPDSAIPVVNLEELN
jgi:cell division protein FtsW